MSESTSPAPTGPGIVPCVAPHPLPAPGIIPGYPFWQYPRTPALGRSSIHDLYDDLGIEEVYHGLLNLRADTPTFVLGRMLHCLTLTPSGWDEQFMAAPTVERRSDKDKATWAAAQMEAAESHRTLVKVDQVEQATAMRDAALRQSPFLRMILARKTAQIEASLFWQEVVPWPAAYQQSTTPDPIIVPCKGRPDWFDPKLKALMDLKSAKGVRRHEIAKAIVQHGYHFQLAWYSRGLSEAGSVEIDNHLLCFICSEPPHRTRLFRLAPEAITAAWKLMQPHLEVLAVAFATGNWQEQEADEIPYIALPSYATREMMDALEPVEGDAL